MVDVYILAFALKVDYYRGIFFGVKRGSFSNLNVLQKGPYMQGLARRDAGSFLKLGGQVVMGRAAAVRGRLLFCQNLGGQLPRQLRPCSFDKDKSVGL